MRNKRLNNNLTDSISKGGVLYRAGEIPTLNKEQIAQANLVSKLPRDFPFANWESMSTKQQLQQMQHSGLNNQDQWSLLNANVPLSVLDQHNRVQDEVETRAYVARSLAPLAAQTTQASSPRGQTVSNKSLNSTSLQTTAQQRKLDMKQEEYETRFYEKAAARKNITSKPTNPIKTPTTYKPVDNTQPKDSDEDSGKKETLIDKLATFLDNVIDFFTPEKSTPEIVTITTVPPIKSPIMTPSPSPTPKPTPSPTPTPSASELRAQAAVKKGMAYADEGIKYKLGSKNIETGAVDCSGFVVTLLTGAGFKFGQGNLSLGAEYMADSFLEQHLGSEEYDYTKDSKFPPLQAGDLVFSADTDDLTKNEHVTMATGDGLQVVEASSMENVMKVTYQFDAYKTYKNGKYYRDSEQVVTYVIRPFF